MGRSCGRMRADMKFHVLTLFPEMIEQGLHTSITGRAVEAGLLDISAVNIRDFTADKHGKVDDYIYGGGAGMLIQAQPVYDAYQSICHGHKMRTVYVTPQGKTFSQSMAEELAGEEELVILCGHYEGVDERVLEEIVTDYVSIGDYVLTGGELPAMVMIDAISRLVPGVLNNESSAETESFHKHLLEYPQYSRPEVWMDKAVPAVLLSGDHKKINKWRLEQSIERTRKNRPDLYAAYERNESLIKKLSKQKRNHIHMMELLASGNGLPLYHKGDNILLYSRRTGTCMLTADHEEAVIKMLDIMPADCSVCYAMPDFAASMVREARQDGKSDGAVSSRPLRNVCYTLKDAMYVRCRDIRKAEVPEVVENVLPAGHGEVYAVYEEEQPRGYISTEADGAVLWPVMEPGYESSDAECSLIAYAINRSKDKGGIPYLQILEEDGAKIAALEAMGLYAASESVWKIIC